MSITPVEFGSNMRPSVVANIKKINELVDAVNEVDPDSVTALKTQVNTIQTNLNAAQTDIAALKTSVNEISSTIASMLDDINKIKITLYTPLESEE